MISSRNTIYTSTQMLAILALVITTVGHVKLARAEGADSTNLRQVAVVAVHTAATGLGAVLKDISDPQAQLNIIRAFIEPVRFFPDQSGYFYVYNFDCVNVAHAIQKDLVGKNLFDHKDSRGKLDIQALAETAKQGGGFVEYYWVKPGMTEEFKKLGYVEPIPGTIYFIGTGIYLP